MSYEDNEEIEKILNIYGKNKYDDINNVYIKVGKGADIFFADVMKYRSGCYFCEGYIYKTTEYKKVTIESEKMEKLLLKNLKAYLFAI